MLLGLDAFAINHAFLFLYFPFTSCNMSIAFQEASSTISTTSQDAFITNLWNSLDASLTGLWGILDAFSTNLWDIVCALLSIEFSSCIDFVLASSIKQLTSSFFSFTRLLYLVPHHKKFVCPSSLAFVDHLLWNGLSILGHHLLLDQSQTYKVQHKYETWENENKA